MRATSSGFVGDLVALEREQHDDGGQQPVERDRADAGQEPVLVPVLALAGDADAAGEVPGDERDAQEDERPCGRSAHSDTCNACGVPPQPAREQLEVEVAEQAVGGDLEHAS